jgi:hypothetical protein
VNNNKTDARREELIRLYEEYRVRVGGWIQDIWKDGRLKKQFLKILPAEPSDDFEKSEDYKAALNYYREFQQREDVDYSAAISYARELYDRYDKTDKLLDEKADSIIKYLGGGSALITVGTLISIKGDNYSSCVLAIVAIVSLLPSLACAIYAVSNAIQGRRPRASGSLPPVKFAVEIAEYNKSKEKIEPSLWLIFHPICEAAYFRNL